MTDAVLGSRSAIIVGVVGVAYGGVLAVGVSTHGRTEPIGEPLLAIIELRSGVSFDGASFDGASLRNASLRNASFDGH